MRKNSSTYPVEIVSDAFGESPALANLLSGASRVFIVADMNVVQRNESLGTQIGHYVQTHGINLAGTPVVITGGEKVKTVKMKRTGRDLWTADIKGDLDGMFYTFQVETKKKLMDETPGVFAKAVGVNGRRAAIIDMDDTNPDLWMADMRVPTSSPTDLVIYEMQLNPLFLSHKPTYDISFFFFILEVRIYHIIALLTLNQLFHQTI